MAKGFGIAALTLSVICILAPVGLNIVALWAAMLCAAIATGNGEWPLPIAAVVIAAFGLIAFSPLTMAGLMLSLGNGSLRLAALLGVPLTLPLVGAGVAVLWRDVERRTL